MPDYGDNGPPKEDGPPEGPIHSLSGRHATCTNSQSTATLGQLRLRRAASLRLLRPESGCADPEYPRDTRFHRPPTGLRASGFREGYACGAIDVLRKIWPDLDDTARARAATLAAQYQAGEPS